MTSADVVVVGAGTAGSVLAGELARAGRSVVVLEAGPDSRTDDPSWPELGSVRDPYRMHELWQSRLDWGYRSVPQDHADGRRLELPRGRGVGGSHALNAMIWVRGHRADYEEWARTAPPADGPSPWSWPSVERAFERLERRTTPAGRRLEGRLDVVDDYARMPVHEAIVAAASQAGLPVDEDYNDGSPDGICWTQLTIRDGRRLMTSDVHLDADLPALRVVTGAVVDRLLLDDDGRCSGVRYAVDGAVHEVRATDAVVLCAGAIGSPAILQRSGVGDRGRLEAVGIECVLDLPGVGSGLVDHWLVPVVLSVERPIDPPVGTSATQTHLFARSDPSLAVPDLQPINFAAALVPPGAAAVDNAISLMAGLVHPASRGRVDVTGPDPAAAPAIDPQVLSDDADLGRLVAAVRLCERIGAQDALARDWAAKQVHPDPYADDERLADYVRATVTTYHHQSGTCAIGDPATGVVDQHLRVHGLPGLMVADASVMPAITTGNTNAPAALIGLRAADFLLGREDVA